MAQLRVHVGSDIPGDNDHDFYVGATPAGPTPTARGQETLTGLAQILVHNAPYCDIIPDASDIDRGSLTKIREKQLEKALDSLGEDPHGFKADWVGRSNVSKFDAMRDADGRIILVSKDGKILIPTNYRFNP